MESDRLIWQEDDLEIEDPVGSGNYIPMREFNKRIAAEIARGQREKADNAEDAD